MRKGIDWKTYLKGFGKGAFKAAVVSYLFYRNIWFSLFTSVGCGILSLFLEKKEYQKKQHDEITLQFREGLYGIAAALGAGYAMENAIEEARKDLVLLYGEGSLLAEEFSQMQQKLELSGICRALENRRYYTFCAGFSDSKAYRRRFDCDYKNDSGKNWGEA